jgi:hypothetical protein
VSRLEDFRKKIVAMPVAARIARASELTERVLDHTRLVLHLHASNQELNASDQIGRQVPRSYAAHTFNLLRDTQHRFELLRLTALWDAPSENRESIPTLLEYLRHPATLDEMERRYAAEWGQLANTTEILGDDHTPDQLAQIRALLQQSETAFGRQEAAKGRRQLTLAIRAADKLSQSSRLRALVTFRNLSLAHNLDAGASAVTPPNHTRYGDERFILERTIHVVSGLNIGIRGASFEWSEAKRIAQRYAKAFWGGVTVQVLE